MTPDETMRWLYLAHGRLEAGEPTDDLFGPDGEPILPPDDAIVDNAIHNARLSGVTVTKAQVRAGLREIEDPKDE